MMIVAKKQENKKTQTSGVWKQKQTIFFHPSNVECRMFVGNVQFFEVFENNFSSIVQSVSIPILNS